MNVKSITRKATLGLFAVMLAGLSGCSGNEKKTESLAGNTKLASSIKEKYADNEKVTYTDPMFDLERDHMFEMQLDFDLKQYIEDHPDITNFTQIINIYTDADFKDQVNAVYEFDQDKNTMQILPPKKAKFYLNDEKSFDKGESKDWGNAQQYYMVQYMDLETGEMLAKPIVTVFSIKAELGTPNVEFYVREDGTPAMKWDAVEGATEYIVFTYGYDKDSGLVDNFLTKKYKTKETQWAYENDADGLLVNADFNMTKLFQSEEDVKVGDAQTIETKSQVYVWGVIAVNDTVTSKISETFDGDEIAAYLPYREAIVTNRNDNVSKYADKEVSLLPSYKWVVMCDGLLSQRLITYDIEKAEVKNDSFGITDDAGNITGTEKIDYLDIPYTINGTAFKDTARVFYVNKDTYQNELKKLKERQDSLKNKGGSLKSESSVKDDGEVSENEADTFDENVSDKIYANSALGEYLAVNMMNGVSRVNLDEFKESSDRQYLVDAWNEAVYQNPLVLGVTSISMDVKNNDLLIQYDLTTDEIKEKQNAIKTEVEKVVKEIITEDMSDLDKEIAINQYLCETAEYDTAALENAEKNDFAYVDASFNDSFNAYGILINKKGVCASYAASFKLLADEAGLETVVVTGYLDGNLPHAWNRVNIDGEWLSVDSTNNDNDFMQNALFNLPDRVSSATLVEDQLYMMDSKLDEFKATEENKEYYHLQDKFFDKAEIVEQLSNELKENGKALLRTDYALDDAGFQEIAQQVIQNNGGVSLRGANFLGTIYLETAE